MADSGRMPDPRWAAAFEELERQEVTYAAPHDLTTGRIFVDGPIDLGALFEAIDRVPPRVVVTDEYGVDVRIGDASWREQRRTS